MDKNELISIVKKKLDKNISLQGLEVEDKSFLHRNHSGNVEGKYHLKLIILSDELKKMSKINGTKKIYTILSEELKQHIHSLQILIR
jgi:BolA protein